MRNYAVQPNVVSYRCGACFTVLSLVCSEGYLLHLIDLLFSAAITACERSGQWTIAKQLLEEMCTAGLEPDVIVYNAVLSAFAKGGQYERAIFLLDEMRGRGLKPDSISYSCCLLGKFSGSTQLPMCLSIFF